MRSTAGRYDCRGRSGGMRTGEREAGSAHLWDAAKRTLHETMTCEGRSITRGGVLSSGSRQRKVTRNWVAGNRLMLPHPHGSLYGA